MRRLRMVVLGLAILALGMLGACGGGGGGAKKDGSQEVLLGTMDFLVSDAGTFDPASGYLATLSSADTSATLFLATPTLVGGEVGIPFETAAGERPDSDAYFAALTNGVDEATSTGFIRLPSAGDSANSGAESVRIQRLVPELVGPDLAGATIMRLVLTFTTADVVTGTPYSLNLQGTVMFFGTIDVP